MTLYPSILKSKFWYHVIMWLYFTYHCHLHPKIRPIGIFWHLYFFLCCISHVALYSHVDSVLCETRCLSVMFHCTDEKHNTAYTAFATVADHHKLQDCTSLSIWLYFKAVTATSICGSYVSWIFLHQERKITYVVHCYNNWLEWSIIVQSPYLNSKTIFVLGQPLF